MSDINIRETTKFDNVTSFLDSSLTKLNEYSTKLESIGSGLTGELLSTYNKAANPVKTKIANIESSINGAKGHINRSLAIYSITDDTLKDKLDNIYDYIFSDDLSFLLAGSSSNDLLTEDEKQTLLISLCLTNGASNTTFLDMINDNNNLSESDKKYIIEQLDKGNIRSAIGRVLCVGAEEDLAYLEETNNKKIEEYNEELADLYTEREIANMSSLDHSEKLKDIDDKINSIEKNIKDLQNEITAQRMVVNQYKISEKEWEYDYLLNKVGTDEFEAIVSTNADKDFFKDALEHYFTENHEFTDLENSSGIFDYEHFYNKTSEWLNSSNNGLSTETKNKYLEKLKSMSKTGSLLTEDNYAFYLAAKELSGDIDSDKFNELYSNNALNTIDGDISLKNANKYFDEDHLKVYNYLYNSGDYEAAKEYLNTFSDYFNKCKGMEKASEMVNNIISADNLSDALGDATAFFNGTGLGIENWFQSVGNLFSSTGQMTETEYTQMYVNNMLGSIGLLTPAQGSYKDLGLTEDAYKSLKNKYGDNLTYLDIMYDSGKIDSDKYQSIIKLKDTKNLDKFIGNASQESAFGKTHSEWLQTFFGAGISTGNMVPSIAVSYLTGGLLTEAGVALNVTANASKLAGLGTMFLGCTSSSKNESLRNGRSDVEAWTYGVLNGLSETATEYLIGGMPGLSRLDDTFKLLATDGQFGVIGKALLNTLAIGPAQEITEEMAQALVFDPLVSTIAYGEKADGVSVDELLDIAIQTYISTGALGGITNTSQAVNTAKANNSVVYTYELNGQTVDVTYKMLLDSINPDTGEISLDKLATKVSDNSTSITLKDIAEGITSIFKKSTATALNLMSGVTGTTLDTVLSANEELFDANTMPLSSNEERRKVQLKFLNGEKLSPLELIKFREIVEHSIDGYEFKSDHAYRAMSVEEYLEHEKTGTIEGPANDVDYEETTIDGVTYNNNAGVDWYLGGSTTKYGKVIIEAPAAKKYFVTASDGGNAMSLDPTIKHLKSSPHNNPVPLSLTKIVVGEDLVLETKLKEGLSAGNGPINENIIKLVNTEEFKTATVEEQKEMISKIQDYDSLPTDYKLKLYRELLDESAAEKGMTVKELGNQDGDGIVDPNDKAEANNEATKIRNKAEKIEPAITKLMESLEDNNSILIGLKYRLKGKESIERKILFDHNHAKISIADAADRIADSVRYTMIIDEENYTEKAMSTLKTLQDAGYTITKAANTWDNAYYKGLNTSIKAPDGTVFEVQFHTTDSFIIKDCESHVYYEVRRNEYVDKADKDLAKEIQRLYTSTIPIPQNVIGYDFLKELNSSEQTKTLTKKTIKVNDEYTLELNVDEKGKFETTISEVAKNHILYGDVPSKPSNKPDGGHNINNMLADEDNYVVDKITENPDGTLKGEYAMETPTHNKDGSISGYKLSIAKKNNTFFPPSWSNDDIINAVVEVGKTEPIAVRIRNDCTIHRAIINGVEIEVMKNGSEIQTGYPTGTTGQYAPVSMGFIDLRANN